MENSGSGDSDASFRTSWSGICRLHGHATEPNALALGYVYAGTTAAVSNFVTSKVDTAGNVNIYNGAPSGVSVTLTVQGWYGTSSSVAVQGVVGASRAPVRGADVFLYVQPTDSNTAAAADDSDIPTTIVGAAKTSDSGAFTINLPQSAVSGSLIDSDGKANFEVDIADATNEIDYVFSATTPAAVTQPWLDPAGDGTTALALNVDMTAGTAYDLADDPAQQVDETGANAAGPQARQVNEDPRFDMTDVVASSAAQSSSTFPQYSVNSSNRSGMPQPYVVPAAPNPGGPVGPVSTGPWARISTPSRNAS